jgi:hypothetical protein
VVNFLFSDRNISFSDTWLVSAEKNGEKTDRKLKVCFRVLSQVIFNYGHQSDILFYFFCSVMGRFVEEKTTFLLLILHNVHRYLKKLMSIE